MSEMMWGIIDLIVTGFEVWGLTFMMRNEKRKCEAVGVFLFWVLIVLGIFTMTKIGFPIRMKFLCIAILIIGLGKIVYLCKMYKLLLFALLFIVALDSSEMIILQFWNLFNEPIYSDNIIYEEHTLSLIIFAHALFFFIILILEFIMRNANKKRQFRDIFPILISGIPFLVILEIINICLPLVEDYTVSLVFILCSLIVFISFIVNVFLTRFYWELMDKEQQEKKTVYELRLKCDYYLKRMQDEELVKSIYHDLKNHLLLSDDDLSRTKTLQRLQVYEKYYNTGNDFLDIILADKIEQAWKQGVKIECDVDFREGDFFDPLDISTVFGNLLDNAIEATKELEDNEKIIFFKVEHKEELFLIVIKNYISYSVSIDENMLVTNKKNKQYHGFGIPNVKNVVRKYNGECSIKVSDNEFAVSVVIPISN